MKIKSLFFILGLFLIGTISLAHADFSNGGSGGGGGGGTVAIGTQYFLGEYLTTGTTISPSPGIQSDANQDLLIATGSVGVGSSLPVAGLELTIGSAASRPEEKISGIWFTGGTTTTTKPQLLIEPPGTTSSNWNANGTGIGVNEASTASGDLLSLQKASTVMFAVNDAGGNGQPTMILGGFTWDQNSSTSNLEFANNGQVNFQSNGGTTYLFGSSNRYNLDFAGAGNTNGTMFGDSASQVFDSYILMNEGYRSAAASLQTQFIELYKNPTFAPQNAAPVVSGNGQWIGTLEAGTYGTVLTNYNSANPIWNIAIQPTFNIATTSTGHYEALNINPTETSVGAGITNYLIRAQKGGTDEFTVTSGGAVSFAAARKGTFVCTGAGSITVANANMLVTSNVIISMNTAGGTITTPPAMKSVSTGVNFIVLCGATDTSTYNYVILN